MNPNVVDRAATVSLISEIVSRYVDADNPPTVIWDTDEGPYYGRNESGGGSIVLSTNAHAMVGEDQTIWDPDAAQTQQVSIHSFNLQIKICTDVFDDRDLAQEIATTIRTRALSWSYWRGRFASDIGASIIGASPIIYAMTLWDGRRMSFATLELQCLVRIVEIDDTDGTSDYADKFTVQGAIS